MREAHRLGIFKSGSKPEGPFRDVCNDWACWKCSTSCRYKSVVVDISNEHTDEESKALSFCKSRFETPRQDLRLCVACEAVLISVTGLSISYLEPFHWCERYRRRHLHRQLDKRVEVMIKCTAIVTHVKRKTKEASNEVPDEGTAKDRFGIG